MTFAVGFHRWKCCQGSAPVLKGTCWKWWRNNWWQKSALSIKNALNCPWGAEMWREAGDACRCGMPHLWTDVILWWIWFPDMLPGTHPWGPHGTNGCTGGEEGNKMWPQHFCRQGTPYFISYWSWNVQPWQTESELCGEPGASCPLQHVALAECAQRAGQLKEEARTTLVSARNKGSCCQNGVSGGWKEWRSTFVFWRPLSSWWWIRAGKWGHRGQQGGVWASVADGDAAHTRPLLQGPGLRSVPRGLCSQSCQLSLFPLTTGWARGPVVAGTHCIYPHCGSHILSPQISTN